MLSQPPECCGACTWRRQQAPPPAASGWAGCCCSCAGCCSRCCSRCCCIAGVPWQRGGWESSFRGCSERRAFARPAGLRQTARTQIDRAAGETHSCVAAAYDACSGARPRMAASTPVCCVNGLTTHASSRSSPQQGRLAGNCHAEGRGYIPGLWQRRQAAPRLPGCWACRHPSHFSCRLRSGRTMGCSRVWHGSYSCDELNSRDCLTRPMAGVFLIRWCGRSLREGFGASMREGRVRRRANGAPQPPQQQCRCGRWLCCTWQRAVRAASLRCDSTVLHVVPRAPSAAHHCRRGAALPPSRCGRGAAPQPHTTNSCNKESRGTLLFKRVRC